MLSPFVFSSVPPEAPFQPAGNKFLPLLFGRELSSLTNVLDSCLECHSRVTLLSPPHSPGWTGNAEAAQGQSGDPAWLTPPAVCTSMTPCRCSPARQGGGLMVCPAQPKWVHLIDFFGYMMLVYQLLPLKAVERQHVQK